MNTSLSLRFKRMRFFPGQMRSVKFKLYNRLKSPPRCKFCKNGYKLLLDLLLKIVRFESGNVHYQPKLG